MKPINYAKIPLLLLPFYQERKRNLPWREDRNPYHVWISEIMLQQTRIETVIPYYYRFLENLPTVQDLAEVEEEKLLKLWEGLGYYSRARNLQKAARMIMEKYQGVFPSTIDSILSLPGVGPYTAGAIASIAFQLPEPAIDGNVFRVFSRLSEESRAIDDRSYQKELHQLLRSIYPREAGDFTEALMELGETICLPNTAPLCEECPLSSLCESYHHQSQRQYPVIVKKIKIKKEKRIIFLLNHEEKYAIRKRKDSGLLASLYEFPNVLEEEKEIFLNKHNILSIEEVFSYKHIFSHIHWENRVFVCQVSDENSDYFWFTKEELKKVAIPSAFQKVQQFLQIK